MGENSKIGWTHHTFNPWIGCTKISGGCAHCYAEAQQDHLYHRARWGVGQPRVKTKDWSGPRKWNREAYKLGVRYRVFCASLADVFDEEVPDSWRDELFQLIVETPNLDWLLLTKRVFKAKEYLFTKPTLANVWLGASVENQEAVFDRLPILGSIPAQVLFISAEPLLGPIDVRPYLLDSVKFKSGSLMGEVVGQKLDWVICGGESGEGYRGMNPVWAMNLYAQCQSAGTAFFMKQGSAVKSGCQGSIPNGLWDIKEFPKFGRLI